MKDKSPVLVLDSGVGGLSVLAQLRQVFPWKSFIYWADTAFFPYGEKNGEILLKRLEALLRYSVENMGISQAIVACHTASCLLNLSSLLWEEIPHVSGISLCGMSEPLLCALKALNGGEEKRAIGLLLTENTLHSGLYVRMVHSFPFLQLFQRACPDLVRLIEGGHFQDLAVQQALLNHLENLKEEAQRTGHDALLVIPTCTHFSFLLPLFEELSRQDRFFTYLDPVQLLIQELKKDQNWGKENVEKIEIQGKLTFMATGKSFFEILPQVSALCGDFQGSYDGVQVIL